MSDPASLSAAREKAINAAIAALPGYTRRRNGLWEIDAGDLESACMHYAAALSGEPPAEPLREQMRWHGCLTGDCPHQKQAECDAHLAQAYREFAAAGVGEPPAPTPEPADELLAAFSHIESAEWVDSQFVLRVFYGDDADTAEFEGTPIETLRQAAAMYREALAVPPAAPTAATPEPGNDPNLMLALQASGVTPQYIERALDAIADWHRRTLGGEPGG